MFNKWLVLLLIVLFSNLVIGADVLTSDSEGNLKLDFAPEEIVYVHGSGFYSKA